MTSYWVLLNQGALKVKAGSYLPTKEPGDCQVSLCHQLPSTGLFSAWVEPLEGFNWASNLWDPWSLGTSSGGPWEKNVPSPSDSNRRVGKKTANGGMVRTQEQWKRRCKHQHISVLHSSLWSLWSLWSSGSLWIKSSPSSAPDLYGWCMPWSRCCRWRSKELVLYGFFVGNPWASDLMQIRSWDGLDRCHEPERCDKLSSHHLDQEWLRAFQLDPCVLSSVPPQWVEDKSPHHRCFGRLAGWASFWGSCSIFEDLGHVAVLNVVTKRFLGKVHGVVTAWTVQQWSQTQGNSHIFGTALSNCKDLLEAFGPVVLVNLPSQVARASGSGVSQPQQVLLWLCCYRGSWCKDTLVRCCRHSESAATPRLPHMKSQAIAWATNTRMPAGCIKASIEPPSAWSYRPGNRWIPMPNTNDIFRKNRMTSIYLQNTQDR